MVGVRARARFRVRFRHTERIAMIHDPMTYDP